VPVEPQAKSRERDSIPAPGTRLKAFRHMLLKAFLLWKISEISFKIKNTNAVVSQRIEKSN
jgi:hypothetical protein